MIELILRLKRVTNKSLLLEVKLYM